MKNKTLTILVFGIFLFSLVSAGDYKFQNKSGYDLMVIGGNGDVNISQNLNLGNGTIWYNDSAEAYYYYNTTTWVQFGTGTGSSSGATTPTNAVMSFNLASCPAGWILADGTSSTPNLSNQFINGEQVMKQYYANSSDGPGSFNITAENWTTERGVAIPYKDKDGNWRMKLNIKGVFSSIQTDLTMTIEGVVFKVDSVLSTSQQTTTPKDYEVWVNDGGGTIRLISSVGTTAGRFLSGDVELDSKPTWADADASLIYCVKTETEDSSNALFQRLGQYISFLNVSDMLNISSGNISLAGKLFRNDGGVLKWGGVEVGTGGNTTVNYGQNSSGAYVPLSVDGSGILNLNVVTTEGWDLTGTNMTYTGGNVGIGTASPEGKLHVKEASNNSFILNERGDGLFVGLVSGSTGNSILFDDAGIFTIGEQDNANKGTVTGITNHFTIQNTTGNVGIGTGSPTEKLDVVDAIRIVGSLNTDLYLENGGGSANSLMWWRNSSGESNYYMGQIDENGAWRIYNYGVSEFSLMISPTTGNVGINDVNTLSKLSVIDTDEADNVFRVEDSSG
ncbi:MAG: hypothetical protein ABFQ65_03500, partial [Nanoarchaeota archaeon]